MSNVNLAEVAATTTYAVSLEQVAQLIADNLNVPVEAVDVRYNLASRNYDGPGYAGQYVANLTVTVDNQGVERLRQAERRRTPIS